MESYHLWRDKHPDLEQSLPLRKRSKFTKKNDELSESLIKKRAFSDFKKTSRNKRTRILITIISICCICFFFLTRISSKQPGQLSTLTWIRAFWLSLTRLSLCAIFILTLVMVYFNHHLLVQTILLATFAMISGFGMMLNPSLLWHPFSYHYWPVPMSDVLQASQNACVIKPDLCLTHQEWIILSNGGLSKDNIKDIHAVHNGVQFTSNKGGLVVNVLARDVESSIPTLQKNVESIAPFWKNLTVVILENDSVDNSRKMFKNWAELATDYSVDLMTCEDLGDRDCKLKEGHRYDSLHFTASSVGKMVFYRNHVLNYVLQSKKYEKFTHMIVIDLDLGVSLSPLGILHSIGKDSSAVVAVNGRQFLPASLGSITLPYDFTAFRATERVDNKYLLHAHKWFCGLAPPKSRLRNNCDVMSPFQMILISSLDIEYVEEMYEVDSAFHGATIYPLEQVRKSGAKYDAGTDNQRCEHIGFNLGLKSKMYMNPKWKIILDASSPGGPVGLRFVKLLFSVGFFNSITFIYVITYIIPLGLTFLCTTYIYRYTKKSLLSMKWTSEE